MKDNCQREITYLRLSVTDLCNLRCRYCMPAEGVAKKQHSEICSVEELVEMAAAAADCGVTKVRLTGGEPLVRRGIVDICRGVAALPGVREVDMTTNGILLPELARPLREAGLHRLNVSLDTLRPDRYAHMTRLGRLEDALAGLRAAVDAGFTGTKLNVVLMAGFNDDEIEDFVALTAEYPLEVRFIELMPMGQADAGVYLPGDTVLERCRSLVPAEPSGVARRWRLPLRPHPHHRRRAVEALPPLLPGDHPSGAPWRGAAAGYPGWDRRQAGAPPHGGGGPQSDGPKHERDRRMSPWS